MSTKVKDETIKSLQEKEESSSMKIVMPPKISKTVGPKKTEVTVIRVAGSFFMVVRGGGCLNKSVDQHDSSTMKKFKITLAKMP